MESSLFCQGDPRSLGVFFLMGNSEKLFHRLGNHLTFWSNNATLKPHPTEGVVVFKLCQRVGSTENMFESFESAPTLPTMVKLSPMPDGK